MKEEEEEREIKRHHVIWRSFTFLSTRQFIFEIKKIRKKKQIVNFWFVEFQFISFLCCRCVMLPLETENICKFSLSFPRVFFMMLSWRWDNYKIFRHKDTKRIWLQKKFKQKLQKFRLYSIRYTILILIGPFNICMFGFLSLSLSLSLHLRVWVYPKKMFIQKCEHADARAEDPMI